MNLWQQFQAYLKAHLHLRPHQLDLGGHNNQAAVDHINSAVGAAIDKLDPSAAIGPVEHALKVRPEQLKGSPIPAALHDVAAAEINAVVAAKLAAETAPKPGG